MPELRRCPVGSVEPATALLVSWWQDWRASDRTLLPFDGSFRDQPAWLVEAFLCAEGALSKAQIERVDAAQAELARARDAAKKGR